MCVFEESFARYVIFVSHDLGSCELTGRHRCQILRRLVMLPHFKSFSPSLLCILSHFLIGTFTVRGQFREALCLLSRKANYLISLSQDKHASMDLGFSFFFVFFFLSVWEYEQEGSHPNLVPPPPACRLLDSCQPPHNLPLTAVIFHAEKNAMRKSLKFPRKRRKRRG